MKVHDNRKTQLLTNHPSDQVDTATEQGIMLPPTSYTPDSHPPTLVLFDHHPRTHRRWSVYATNLGYAKDCAWEYDLLVNCTGKPISSDRTNTIPPGTIPTKWTHPLYSREIVIDWPDFQPPNLPVEFWKDLFSLIKRKRKTLVFCLGGHGRTGTCISILATLAFRVPGDEAIAILREQFCRNIVETQAQEGYVRRVGELIGIKGRK